MNASWLLMFVLYLNFSHCVWLSFSSFLGEQAARQLGNELGEELLRGGAAEILAGIINPQGTGLEAPKKKN
jgi:hypothetical protein